MVIDSLVKNVVIDHRFHRLDVIYRLEIRVLCFQFSYYVLLYNMCFIFYFCGHQYAERLPSLALPYFYITECFSFATYHNGR